MTNHSAFDNMLDVRTTSRVMELADTGKMAQLEKGRTFDSYADFIKEVESYEEKTCTKFVKHGAKTVAAKNKEIGPGKANYSNKFVYSSVRLNCKHAGHPNKTGKGIRPNQR